MKEITCFEDLKYRGLVYDTMGNIAEKLNNSKVNFYVGIDPTGNGSGLHIGHTMAILVCKHLQKYGHIPYIILGGATSSLGDPSGRDSERPEISLEQIASNTKKIEAQVRHLLGDDVVILNNKDWMDKLNFVDFMRIMGKVVTVNQMLAKSSVKSRIEREQGISLQEFNYALVQGYDFLHMYREHGCTLEIGGQDQWSNIEIGVSAIHKKEQYDAMALTWPLVIDPTTGKKFGKTAEGKAVWLDPNLTSPYEMYQFFLNVDDENAEQLIKKFTLLDIDEIELLISLHKEDPSKRMLQKQLAKEVVSMVHSEQDYKNAVISSKVLFGNVDKETLCNIDDDSFEAVFNGVPTFSVNVSDFDGNGKFIDTMVACGAFESKGSLRKLIQSNGVSTNGVKVSDVNMTLSSEDLIHGKYLLIKKGKKSNILIIAK